MARTNKTGLDYFSFDIDFFEDDKIQLVEAEFGIKGSYITIRLLCKIYKEGYFYKWGSDECLLFTKNLGVEGVSKNSVDEIVFGLVRRCFFDKERFDRFGILTSKGIQKRYFEATKRCQSIEVIKEYLLVDVSSMINVHINSINANINSQSKIKENKLSLNRDIPPVQKKTDFGMIMKTFNETSTGLPKIRELSDARKKKIARRLIEMGNDLQKLQTVFEKTEKSDFLKGNNQRGWRATFDWIFENETNWVKIIEGNYDNQSSQNKQVKETTKNINDLWETRQLMT
jgi:hypothetical protein